MEGQDITNETYVKLITELFKTLNHDRRSDLREKLNEALNDVDDYSDLALELPLKMRKRDTKVL